MMQRNGFRSLIITNSWLLYPFSNNMRSHVLSSAVLSFLLWDVPSVLAGSWGFSDATVSVHGKRAGVGGGAKEK